MIVCVQWTGRRADKALNWVSKCAATVRGCSARGGSEKTNTNSSMKLIMTQKDLIALLRTLQHTAIPRNLL